MLRASKSPIRRSPSVGGSTHAQRRSGTTGRVGSRWLRSGKPPVRWIREWPPGEAGREMERKGGGGRCTGEPQAVGRMWWRQTAERLLDHQGNSRASKRVGVEVGRRAGDYTTLSGQGATSDSLVGIPSHHDVESARHRCITAQSS
ncbi:hypothetical protein THAOC_21609 [Thalassiosira oceanica]|uniref:Uncharacterized protein n=1 Tax=Thalassiosira oceanica TaxID=159749 RepID=K0SBJ4_THAOC|nr:hypothetical protein THAOC_21609 [Thalassiosira oceanica]|eukprot:EJK58281.1 hypothetical protein THAOC_21609 [Thalassiosira oceanica]